MTVKDFLSKQSWPDRLDSCIRFFFYVLIFWLPYSAAVIESCVIAALVLWIIKRIVFFFNQRGQKSFLSYIKIFKPQNNFLNPYIWFFVVVCIISVVLSDYRIQSWHNFLTKTSEWFVIYWLIIESFKTKKQIYTALGIMFFTTVAVVVDGFVQYYITQEDFFNGYPLAQHNRATASFRAPTGLGAYLTVPIVITTGFLFLRQKFKNQRIWTALALIVLIWSVILTYTRGAWLACFTGIVFFVLVFQRDMFKSLKIKLVCIAIMVVIVSGFLFLTVNKRLEINNLTRPTAQWRIGIWRDSMLMVKDKPFFGHGVNTYMMLFQDYRTETKHNIGPTYAHNCYLQIWTETGTLGLVGFLMIVGRLFQYSLSRIRACYDKIDKNLLVVTIAVLAAVFAFLVHSFFDTHFYSLKLSSLLWYLVGLLVALLSLSQYSTQRKNQYA